MCDVFFCFFIKVKLLKESLHQTCLGIIVCFVQAVWIILCPEDVIRCKGLHAEIHIVLKEHTAWISIDIVPEIVLDTLIIPGC